MIGKTLTKIFGSKNDRELKRIQPLVERINQFEERARAASDAELVGRTAEFKGRLENGESLDELLPEAFATVRDAARRTLGQRPFDVQLIGGIALHEGKIAEMITGEGKTLAATMPIYLNALTDRGVHLVTVNDYLARRDAEWMGTIYRFLGLDVGYVVHGMDEGDRQKAYRADVTYGQNNEFGFDYLRDNMKHDPSQWAQRDLHYAIVDEVDSILVDEARTPLIISGPTDDSPDEYYRVDKVAKLLKAEEHYTVDEKARSAMLTDEGISFVEERLALENIYDPGSAHLLHMIEQSLKAYSVFERDVHYVVKQGKVIIVDEFTGRMMDGRRFSDRLHQALEAKEGVPIESENQTLATVTFQNYFRMYDKLAGMTGTADTEAVEFKKIYDLDVLVIPSNVPMIRDDRSDMVYKTEKAKFKAVIEDIVDCHERGQPVLVGTVSIEKSERLSKLLKVRRIPHHVLNAKQHEREAEIVTQAGRFGAVTISTNMAGRGTDIKLGGNPEGIALLKADPDEAPEEYAQALAEAQTASAEEKKKVIQSDGLHILGTERHESRRIDNQLRGRSGRQGDPGSSRFYLSLEDDLMRIFGADRMPQLALNQIPDDMPIESNMVSKMIEGAQRKVEGHHFDIRKHLLEYDDVMNMQREVVYGKRREVLTSDNLDDEGLRLLRGAAQRLTAEHAGPKQFPEDWDRAGLSDELKRRFGCELVCDEDTWSSLTYEGLEEMVHQTTVESLERKAEEYGPKTMLRLERLVLLSVIDRHWKQFLRSMDDLKGGIGLVGYAQRNPLSEFKREGYDMFENMMERVDDDAAAALLTVRMRTPEEVEADRARQRRRTPINFSRDMLPGMPMPQAMNAADQARPQSEPQQERQQTVRRATPKVGRNDPCPCGSGKKYKKCCGA
ncbi:MAG: preprotein translocase subunit SecA [Candidatus Alcyoniella australis]|nr:preprotein translocase subunit SecA [Candidatus Alcyoniella australis]